MSQRTIKKQRKEIRRRVDANFGVGMQALSNVTRDRPRWVPKWAWILAYAPLIRSEYLHHFYKHMK
jgi:hypothetical protein